MSLPDFIVDLHRRIDAGDEDIPCRTSAFCFDLGPLAACIRHLKGRERERENGCDILPTDPVLMYPVLMYPVLMYPVLMYPVYSSCWLDAHNRSCFWSEHTHLSQNPCGCNRALIRSGTV